MPTPRPEVRGLELDTETRCAHYHSHLDVIAIKIACCGIYYACKDCHEALANHPIEIWRRPQWESHAVLCGVCSHELTINEYLQSGYACPSCEAPFNPGCRNHYEFYFETTEQL